MKIGIITGASSGLGRAYAKRADKTMDLDELWLIARREDRLRDLAGELNTPAKVLPLDLTERESAARLEALLEREDAREGLLVFAAGFGKFGRAEDMSLRENEDMIDLNCRAAVDVTRVCIPRLTKGSRVLEICSSAAFQPLPGMNIYAATKAFLLRYTRALRRERAGRGVKITAVCPFWIKTEFMEVARRTENPTAVRHTPFAMRPEAVAAWSLDMNALGLAVATCGPIPLIMRIGSKIQPSCVTMGVWEGGRRV